ncbi:AAA family ATPase [Sulfurimonas sp.]
MIYNDFDRLFSKIAGILDTKYDGKSIQEEYNNKPLEDIIDDLSNNTSIINSEEDREKLKQFFSLITQNKNHQVLRKIDNKAKGDINFSHRNILFKGVPGTGKSEKINDIVEHQLKMKGLAENILRINIHSASSNADLMQGIGITTTDDNQVAYHEKQGLIYKHIHDAIYTPNQPFVLILEEIQENSLNELIGDLIYLIEGDKRTTIDSRKLEENKEYGYQKLIEAIAPKHYVKIPFLVNTSTDYRKMILPSNLYIFCTSNYRDDKKVIEDNLLRRFDVIEMYPQYKADIGDDFISQGVSDFLYELNEAILKVFNSSGEIHPDRFLIGHANWLKITDNDGKGFYKALLKVVIDFKEIKEIDFASGIKEVFKEIRLNEENWVKKYFEAVKTEKDYKSLVEELQKQVYDDILNNKKTVNE